MEIDLAPTLVEQYRETFEGEVHPGWSWITDGKPESALIGTLAGLTAEQAFASPIPGAKSVAAHVEHLRFTLDITMERLNGRDPKPDWAASFQVPPCSEEAWTRLKAEVQRAYQGVREFYEKEQEFPIDQWPPIVVVGLSAMIAHNAYHLGAIRQIAQVVKAS
jgi:hypothetical protein